MKGYSRSRQTQSSLPHQPSQPVAPLSPPGRRLGALLWKRISAMGDTEDVDTVLEESEVKV